METLARLSLRYRSPPALGVATAQELADLLNQVSTASTSYDAALAVLLEIEISLLRQKVETMRAASGAEVSQGLAVRLASLERELRLLIRQSGTGGSDFRVVSGGSPVWIPPPPLGGPHRD